MDGNGNANADVRSDWTLDEVRALHELPFADLMHRAQSTHRRHFDPNQVQVSTLLSIKAGACPEDCAYCPPSIRFDTALEREAGATRFCMGATRRLPCRGRRARARSPG
jgi:biotin synthase